MPFHGRKNKNRLHLSNEAQAVFRLLGHTAPLQKMYSFPKGKINTVLL